jgi:hypothetical protein
MGVQRGGAGGARSVASLPFAWVLGGVSPSSIFFLHQERDQKGEAPARSPRVSLGLISVLPEDWVPSGLTLWH